MKKVTRLIPPFLLRPDADCVWLFAPNERELFAYWRLSERTKRMAELHAGVPWTSLARKLRVYETSVSGPANSVWETTAEPDGSLYVQGTRSGAVYMADIGYCSPEGAFVALCRSEPIEAPGAKRDEGTGNPEAVLRFLPFHDERFSGYTLYLRSKQDGGRTS